MTLVEKLRSQWDALAAKEVTKSSSSNIPLDVTKDDSLALQTPKGAETAEPDPVKFTASSYNTSSAYSRYGQHFMMIWFHNL